MHEYLKHLYNYILESRMSSSLQKRVEYQSSHIKVLDAWREMEKVLTDEQKKVVNDLLDAKAQVSTFEDEWLFQEGVALGKWLARP